VGGELRPVTWPVAPFLVELLAYDDGERMAFLHDESLARLGVTADAARLAAHGNLTKPGLAVVQAEGIAGAWAIAGPSSYQSSWLAAHTWLAGTAAARVEGDPLVVAPTRDQAMVLGSADPATVAAVLRWAEVAYGDGARPLSPVLYRLDRRRLAPWVPDADHPCRPRVERSGRILAFQEYSAQREHLQPLFDAAGDDMYVGEIGLHERPGGGVFTWTTWSALVDDALMPPADYVQLVAADGDGFWVAWDALQSEAGDLLTEEPGWGLPRHRAGAWPDPARLARLRARATDPFTS
jgi:hypothetical protein